jgi:acylglycerol lipase
MKHQEGFFKGIRGVNIYYQCWLPEDEPKAVLLIVHGLAEHSGRYINVVNHFVPLGYAVYGVDLIGHGKSGGARVYVERFEDYTDTLKTYFDMVRDWQPKKPIFLVGHSVGGLIGPSYLLEHQAELSGAVISAPLVQVPDNISPPVVFVSKVLSTLMPKFGLMRVEADGVSQDPEVVQAYINDPLVYRGKTTARLSAELLKAMQRVTAEAARITLPILILQGSADKLVAPDGARMLYASVSSSDKTLHVYDGCYHEVFNEPERDQVLGDVEAWLEARLAPG